MTESAERIEMSHQDEEDLKQLLTDGKPPEFHTVLQVWREVLEPAEKLSHEKITPQYASKMVATYPRIEFNQMPRMQELYFSKIQTLAKIVDFEIKTDAECLSYRSPEEDAEHNAGHYRNVLTDWQLQFLQWELDWDTTADDAAVELASISELHKMFFGPTGLTAYLDNIKFEFSEQDQAVLATALAELREGQVMRDE